MVSSCIIKETAERFIAQFSQTDLPENFSSPMGALLSEEELCRIKTEAVAAQTLFQQGKEGSEMGPFYYIGRGKHNYVWGHRDFPTIVLKHMGAAEAEHQVSVARAAHTFATAQRPFWCRIPLSLSLDLPGQKHLYIEERLELGLSMEGHQEFWARIFNHLDSPSCTLGFKENMQRLVGQIGSLIEEIGFWDVGFHNLPEVSLDGRYVCAVDFENVKPDKGLMHDGLRRLNDLFAHPLFTDCLLQMYGRSGAANEVAWNEKNRNAEKGKYKYLYPVKTEESCLEDARKNLLAKQAETQALQEALIVCDTERATSSSDHFEGANLTPEEISLAQDLVKAISKRRSDKTVTISSLHSISIQPGCWNKMYSKDRFINVLTELKKQGLVISWFCELSHHNSALTPYTIYFR